MLNGKKQWISNGGVADLYSVLALAPGGPSWFVVDRDTDGFTHGKHEDKHGIRLSNTAALFLDDVRVDADRLVGGVEGQGLVQAQQVFGYTRLMVAAFGLGAGWAALDRAIPYSQDRIQAGGPLSEKQGYTHKLVVPHVVRLEAARAVIEETAARLDGGEGSLNTEGAIAKYLASEAGNGAADAAIQALGGYGYTHEYLVEKIKRDVRITTIYEGTSEIMEMTIARDRWQLHLKTRGDHYHDEARNLESLHATHPTIGADVTALAHHALAELLESCRVARLTRHQHVLLRLGELVAVVEGAGASVRRAARATDGELHAKADLRFDALGAAAIARVNAREALSTVVADGARWAAGAGGDVAGLAASRRPHRAGRRAGRARRRHGPRRRPRVRPRTGPHRRSRMTAETRRRRCRDRGDPARCSRRRRPSGTTLRTATTRSVTCGPSRWDPNLYYDEDPKAPDKSYSKIGGWVRAWEWDPLGWHLPVPPKVGDSMDDAQKWAVACTRAALVDYGWPERPIDGERTAVILGNAMAGEQHYLTALRIAFPEFARELEGAQSFAALPEDLRAAILTEVHLGLDQALPEITEDTMPGELGNCMAGRIANLFDLHGPNYVVDAACASALAAFDASV